VRYRLPVEILAQDLVFSPFDGVVEFREGLHMLVIVVSAI
jgi:hypothetical protein